MKAAPFEFVRAASALEACEILRREGDAAKLIAGGQSLVPIMAMRLVRPTLLVDINEIPSLKFIDADADAARVGACTRQAMVERDPQFSARVPLVARALAWVGHAQTRNRGTVGGSLAHADPCAELPLAAQVLQATLVVRTANATRELPAREFFTGPMSTALAADECLEEIRWPVWKEPRVGCAFTEISNRHGDFAMVAAAAQVALDADGRCVRAALGIGGVGPTPLDFPELARRLVGTRLEDDVIASVAPEAAAATAPGNDLFATAEYRRSLARTLAARVLKEARENAKP